MRKSTFFLFLLSVLLLGTTEVIASSGSYTHTNTPIELEPTSLNNSYQTAAVCFLGVGDCDTVGDYRVNTEDQCLNDGFDKNTCSSVQIPATPCPYDEIGYGKGCKCRPDLVSCNSPYVGSGEACGGKYAACECPPTVSPDTNEICSLTCDGNCVEKACKPATSETGCSYGTQSCPDGCGGSRSCCSTYVAPPACIDECPSYSSRGPASSCAHGGDDCYDGCSGDWWHNCNSAPSTPDPKPSTPDPEPSTPDPAPSDPCDYVTAANCGNLGCKSNYSSCSRKCQTCNIAPVADPCDGLTAANCGSLGCKSNYSNCPSKCQTCNTPPADPCDSVTAVSVPSNAYCSGHHSSCSSKCSGWSCNDGYSKSGNSCVKNCVPLTEYAGDECCKCVKSVSTDDGCGGKYNKCRLWQPQSSQACGGRTCS